MASWERDGISLREINRTHNPGYVEPREANAQRSGSLWENDRPTQEFSLPPVDGGKYAWLFLAGCFTIEALVWGKPFVLSCLVKKARIIHHIVSGGVILEKAFNLFRAYLS